MASIQKGLDGAFVGKRTESRKYDIFRNGAFEATLASDAPEAIQKRMGAMEEAELPEKDGGGKKFTQEDIDAWVEAWCENRIRAIAGVKKKDKKGEDRLGLLTELVNYVRGDAEPTVEKRQVVRRTAIYSTDMFKLSINTVSLEKKLKGWRDKLAKAHAKGDKAKAGSKAREKLAEVERTVEGQKRQWVQGAIRLLPKVTVDDKGAWDLHGDKLHDAILLGKGLREGKGN